MSKRVTRSTTSATTVEITPPRPPLPSTHHPLLPTPTELLLLATYPLTLLLGSLFSHLSPTTRPPLTTSTYSHIHQSFQPPSAAPSYFATKRNVFNLYFVKLGWFWCTAALAAFTLLAARGRAAIDLGIWPLLIGRERRPVGSVRLHDMGEEQRIQEEEARLRRRWQVLLRWGAATGVWWVVTQGTAGGSLIDRLYRLTGGLCEAAAHEDDSKRNTGLHLAKIATYKACRAAGGSWRGGYDLSGHVFLLVLASGVLAFEVLPVVLPWVVGLTDGRVVSYADNEIRRLGETEQAPDKSALVHADATTFFSGGLDQKREGPGHQRDAPHPHHATKLKSYGTALAIGVVLLSWWMLLMTAAFFHTWIEKTGALVLAGAVLWGIYIFPRAVPRVRNFVGLPGA